jgi:uncharacterized protein YsxB (DUF464 family)
MTTVIFRHVREDGPVYFDCKNHAQSDVCVSISTLVIMLVLYVRSLGYEPTVLEDGHTRIEMDESTTRTNEVFKAAEGAFRWLQGQYPDDIRVI